MQLPQAMQALHACPQGAAAPVWSAGSSANVQGVRVKVAVLASMEGSTACAGHKPMSL